MNYKETMEIIRLKKQNRKLRKKLKESEMLYRKLSEDFQLLALKNYVLEIKIDKPWLFKDINKL